MYYRPSQTPKKMDLKNSFEFHTWMIARLIEKSGSDITPLSYYVIAACYERMIKRMTYRVSEKFCDALKNLPSTFDFPEKFPQINASNSNDSHFISFLLGAKDKLKLKTPIDDLVNHKNDLYNQKTYKDFHLILHKLLDLFLTSLNDLKKIHDELGRDGIQVNICDTRVKIDFIAMVGTLL